MELDRRRVAAGGHGPSERLSDGADIVRRTATTDPDVVDAQGFSARRVGGHLETRTEKGLERDRKDPHAIVRFQ